MKPLLLTLLLASSAFPASFTEHVLATGAIFALIAAGIQAVTAVTGRQVLAGVGALEGA